MILFRKIIFVTDRRPLSFAYFVCLFAVSAINLILCNTFDPFLAEKPLFQKETFLHNTFFLLSSYFATHPITLLLEILGRRMHGPSPPPQILGDRPPAPLSLRPWSMSCVCLSVALKAQEQLKAARSNFS